MLNIAENKLNKTVSLKEYKAVSKVMHKKHFKHFNRFLLTFSFIGLIILFLPWTQNITGKGYLTTLRPEQRATTVQSPIPGRIEKWYVQEGDYVSKGDTIMHISEIKNEYFDPNLIARTEQQINSKTGAVSAYQGKVNALNNQIVALQRERTLKLEQARNKLLQANLKVQSDSIDLEAAKTNLMIAERQFNRTEQLQAEGLKATKDVEDKRLKLQETQAKLISQKNKLLTSKNNVINAQVEITRVQAAYTDKISKAQSDKFTASSSGFDAEAQVTKLENSLSNYQIRNSLYYVRAPQSGYINKAIKAGVGETFKEGDKLINIMPDNADLAVEMYINPIDLPLAHKGSDVRIQFDGWPAIIFSGWPNVSTGTYAGKIVAVETFISDNGKYRLLIAPDPNEEPWPKALRAGSGARSIALLEDVPIWFELWRQLNGFPPNYYQADSSTTKTASK
ncbi:biotin attachment protein [Dokdonia pacifica]|uniref:Multidrug resistance efflux pump n=1 Tax=Dokdonia pacifica TaxID=1627892 RepID=A0A238ZES7_9FLAO|nr:HlyD family efflux transporter periplasmic adaptor subunit [Dokdonia pacifica]GGG05857.1 biotin attachment protein [Dokdonia pacifica]SNR81508.1 Multidrug resistance efflux pump [Dokdonia pacifica]